LVREKAAEFQKDGIEVPQHELMSKYKKDLSIKLGERRQRRPEPVPAAIGCPPPVQAPAPAPVPVARLPAPPPQQAPAASPAASPSPSGKNEASRTHGNPKYCCNHDRTEKRKKTKPRNEACRNCQAVIQTNYVEFSLCPTCSEKDHRCMCCGDAAVGPSPKGMSFQGHAQQAPSSPMNAQSSPQQPQSKQPLQQMSPMNLFGMPELLTGPPKAAQANAYNPMASQNMYASQNAYAPQNAYASQNGYNPMASQNMMVMPQFR